MILDLFQSEKGDELYNQLKKDNVPWHKIARDYWNKIYNRYKVYFDENFVRKAPKITLKRAEKSG
jgi:hypothetical protein